MTFLGNAQTFNATEQQQKITVFLNTGTVVGNLGIFDKFTGGDAKAPVTKHRAGGMGGEISYLALPEFGEVTVSRVNDEGRDTALIAYLRTVVGAIYGTVTTQPLDAAGAAIQTPTTYYGRLSSVMPGAADSTSAAPRMFEMTFAIESEGN